MDSKNRTAWQPVSADGPFRGPPLNRNGRPHNRNLGSLMVEYSIADAQTDMRSGYLCGAPGIAASSAAWLAAAALAFRVSSSTAVLTLLIAGAFIHPAGVLLTRLLGSTGRHQPRNPLARLAMEGTFWLLAGIAVAFGMHVLRVEWFFPAMLLLIGGRYLTFQTVYGLPVYWLLGGALCIAGVTLALVKAPAAISALAGGLIELLFAVVVFGRTQRSAA